MSFLNNSYNTNKRLTQSVAFVKQSDLNGFEEHPVLAKTQYGQILVQLIYEELNSVFLSVKQNFEENFDCLTKTNINTAYCTLSRLLSDLKTDSSMAFVPAPDTTLGRSQSNQTGKTMLENEKRSFLVFKKNKYFTIPVEQIAFIYINNSSSTIMPLDGQEYPLDQSLDHVQSSLSSKQFFRLNRQHLVNFDSIKEVEHYFSRKLFVKLVIPTPDKLLIGKERTAGFLSWMEHR